MKVRIGVKPGQLGWSYAELEKSWRAAEESGFDLISCFDHVTDAPRGLAAWDAPTLLAAMAGCTSRIQLAVDVISVAIRHPLLLASQLAVVQAASGGRLEVGLGAGSQLSRHDAVALGRPFPPINVRRGILAHTCQVLPALWRGERVTDELLGIHDASLGRLDIQTPRIVVGGGHLETIRIATVHADGWHAVTPNPAEFGELARRVDEEMREAGRARPLAKGVQIMADTLDLNRARDLVGEMAEAGADTVTFLLHRERGPDKVRRLAESVL